jgi:hypothetical protein
VAGHGGERWREQSEMVLRCEGEDKASEAFPCREGLCTDKGSHAGGATVTDGVRSPSSVSRARLATGAAS